jgi:hypothetical protein
VVIRDYRDCDMKATVRERYFVYRERIEVVVCCCLEKQRRDVDDALGDVCLPRVNGGLPAPGELGPG